MRHSSSFSAASISVSRALRRLLGEPGEKARHRDPVTQMSLARALDLGRVLHGLHQRDRVTPDIGNAACLLDREPQALARGPGIKPHARLRAAERAQSFLEARRLLDLGELGERCAHRIVELAAIEEEARATALGEGWRSR